MARGDLAGVNRLLGAGADVEARGYHGGTPILAAAVVNNGPMVALLMDRGARLVVVDQRGFNLPYLSSQAPPVPGSPTEVALIRVRRALGERGMRQKVFTPAQIRELMKQGSWRSP